MAASVSAVLLFWPVRGYLQLPGSEVLPGIDVDELVRYIDIKPMTRAVTEYRASLRARG